MESVTVARPFRLLSWGGILAGCFAALGIHLLLLTLGVGLGLQAINPLSDPEPGEKFSLGVGIAWAASALIALWIGGWIAGRSVDSGERGTGGVHGFLVWSVSTVVLFVFLAGSAGKLAGGAAKAVGQGLSLTAQTAGAAAGAGAASAGDDPSGLLQQLQESGKDLVPSFVDQVVAGPNNDAAQQSNAQTSAQSSRAKREITMSSMRFLANQNDANHAALVTAISEHGGVARPEAEARVREWEAELQQRKEMIADLRDQATLKARETAERASEGVSKVSIWTFVAFAIGAVAASMGGRAGAASAVASRTGPARKA